MLGVDPVKPAHATSQHMNTKIILTSNTTWCCCQISVSFQLNDAMCFQARELVDGVPGNDALTVTTADATVTIKDVNDEAPTFNNREYSTFIVENPPNGTPLPHLDMSVRDTDVVSSTDLTLT
uniref:Cadherin domain-containing protein n=1 Tax=Timema bartmani TaxID=61472 RepID=A0A7R9I2Y1_9NEOP|nr:unnamed protein product [Timema bartmani]